MTRGGCSRTQSSWNRSCQSRASRDRQLPFQLDSGREHPPRDTRSSETGHWHTMVFLESQYRMEFSVHHHLLS
eukprot:gene21814-biopygen7598